MPHFAILVGQVFAPQRKCYSRRLSMPLRTLFPTKQVQFYFLAKQNEGRLGFLNCVIQKEHPKKMLGGHPSDGAKSAYLFVRIVGQFGISLRPSEF